MQSYYELRDIMRRWETIVIYILNIPLDASYRRILLEEDYIRKVTLASINIYLSYMMLRLFKTPLIS